MPDPRIQEPTDAIVRITHTAICGSDLWFYRGRTEYEPGWRTGHEPIGVVEAVGSEVRTVEPGDLVLAPFAFSDGTCEFCHGGLHTSCGHGGFWAGEMDGAQGEAMRVPLADGTLVRVPEEVRGDDEVLDALFPLTDLMSTGHHAAVCAAVSPGSHLISSRGDEAVGEIRELTKGGTNHVLECVGSGSAMDLAIQAARPGGTIGSVGVPHGVAEAGLDIMGLFFGNLTLRGGPAPVRAYLPGLVERVGRHPRSLSRPRHDGGPGRGAGGLRGHGERRALKVLVRI